jgi:hypothetical protein
VDKGAADREHVDKGAVDREHAGKEPLDEEALDEGFVIIIGLFCKILIRYAFELY